MMDNFSQALITILSIIAFVAANESYHEILEKLRSIQHSLSTNHTLLRSYGHDPDTPAQVLFWDGVFKDQLNDMPILFKNAGFSPDTMGNQVGSYFDSIGCAHLTGMHYIGIIRHDTYQDAFDHAFPYIIPHQNPAPSGDRTALLIKTRKLCHCGRYCWREGQPWESIFPLIRSIMINGLRMHLATPKHGVLPEIRGLILQNATDIYDESLLSKDEFLPLIPDVAIHYRCSDNLFAGMGCLAFSFVLSYIPHDAKYIYIFGEYHSRLFQHTMAGHNDAIMKTLMREIQIRRPNAIVVVKRGSNPYTVMSQFAFANITICSPSTFCLYPAMAREKPTYFPLGTHADYINSNNPIHPNFHFLRSPGLYYSNFTKTTSTEDVLSTLRLHIENIP